MVVFSIQSHYKVLIIAIEAMEGYSPHFKLQYFRGIAVLAFIALSNVTFIGLTVAVKAMLRFT